MSTTVLIFREVTSQDIFPMITGLVRYLCNQKGRSQNHIVNFEKLLSLTQAETGFAVKRAKGFQLDKIQTETVNPVQQIQDLRL